MECYFAAKVDGSYRAVITYELGHISATVGAIRNSFIASNVLNAEPIALS